MSQSFERDGTWWHKREDGVWLRWNGSANVWEQAQAGPPPLLPPSPSSEADLPVSNAAGVGQQAPRASGEEGPAADATPGRDVAVPLPSRRDVIPENVARQGLSIDPSGWLHNRVFLAVLVGMVAIVLSFVGLRSFASGDREDGTPASASGESNTGGDAKDAFIEKADSLCARATMRMKRIAVAQSSPELVGSIVKSIEINQNLLTQIRGLKFPLGNRRLLKRMLAKADEAIEVAKGVPVALVRGDEPAAKTAVERTVELQNKVNELARRYGFDECSRSS
jgi:hypothetical protein